MKRQTRSPTAPSGAAPTRSEFRSRFSGTYGLTATAPARGVLAAATATSRECRRAPGLGVRKADEHANACVLRRFAGQWEEAIPHGEEAVRLAPQRASHRLALGAVLADPTNEFAHITLGNVFANAGHLDEAAKTFGEALRLAHEDAVANLASCPRNQP